jgi:exodeoxyribonuclease V gamma subunit
VPGITIYTSNRLEVLAGALSDLLRHPLDSPLAQEVVMVQSRGMERWLRMRLASAHGISANIWFPFPNRFLQRIFSKIFPDRCRTELFSPDAALWRIMEILPACTEDREFGSLRDYLSAGDGDLKRFQLSSLIADTFDQYLLFRPEMVFRWERGDETHWQAVYGACFRQVMKRSIGQPWLVISFRWSKRTNSPGAFFPGVWRCSGYPPFHGFTWSCLRVSGR